MDVTPRDLVGTGVLNILAALHESGYGEVIERIRTDLEHAKSDLVAAKEYKAAHAVAEVLQGRRFLGELKPYARELIERYDLAMSADD